MKTVVKPGSGDWKSLIECLTDMAFESRVRANNLQADERTRTVAQATADAYLFAVQMIRLTHQMPPKKSKHWKPAETETKL